MAQSDLTPPASVAFDDIQGLVRFGHAHLTEASFVLSRIEDAAAARAWLAAAPVTSARDSHPLPDTALQIAFTSGGLRRMGLAGNQRHLANGLPGRNLGDHRPPGSLVFHKNAQRAGDHEE